MSGENQKMVSLKAPKKYCFEKDNLQKCDQICEELYQEPDEVREAIGVSMSHILKKKKKKESTLLLKLRIHLDMQTNLRIIREKEDRSCICCCFFF